jgi:hypothetical protein
MVVKMTIVQIRIDVTLAPLFNDHPIVYGRADKFAYWNYPDRRKLVEYIAKLQKSVMNPYDDTNDAFAVEAITITVSGSEFNLILYLDNHGVVIETYLDSPWSEDTPDAVNRGFVSTDSRFLMIYSNLLDSIIDRLFDAHTIKAIEDFAVDIQYEVDAITSWSRRRKDG